MFQTIKEMQQKQDKSLDDIQLRLNAPSKSLSNGNKQIQAKFVIIQSR